MYRVMGLTAGQIYGGVTIIQSRIPFAQLMQYSQGKVRIREGSHHFLLSLSCGHQENEIYLS